jgi:cytochrome c553
MNRIHLKLCLLIAVASTIEAAPVARWDFGTEEPSKLESVGGVHRDVPGPRPPTYPDFDANNTAVKFDGAGSHFVFADPGTGSEFDFTNGDAITLEAWVDIADLRSGENVYLIGKGRTESGGFASDNQNWALRLREQKGRACVSFLFATPASTGASAVAKSDAHWHRWTTTEGFAAKSGWHHLAVTYRFGEPESVRGWIDGKSLSGIWDMGGATGEPPVVDDDAIWIGSSKGGAAANSFRGALDAVAVHREILPDDVLKKRFRREGSAPVAKRAKEIMPALGPLPVGQVQVTFHEAMPTHERWLNEGESWPEATLSWQTNHFLLPRLPVRYDDWGIRDAWRSPMLVRLASDVTLTPGKQRFLMRARALGRLWINGQLVARTEAMIKSPPDGEEPISEILPSPEPSLRPAAYFQQEAFGDAEIPADGKCHVVLETVVGGAKLRAETSELCAAVETANGWQLLTGGDASLPLANDAVEPALKSLESNLQQFDDENRRAAAKSQAAFSKHRHTVAQEWAQANPLPALPAEGSHPIDAFLAVKMNRAVADTAKSSLEEARKFHKEVLPILRDACFRCHGDKAKGGLRLNSRAAVLLAGESEKPAVVPGHAEKSELISRLLANDEDERMPPQGDALSADKIAVLKEWIQQGAPWPAAPVTSSDVAAPPVLEDAAFLRRVSLDLIGVPPAEAELLAFLADQNPNKRDLMIDRLLADERWADGWMPYWLDVLSENPALLNATLNSTGPFRWFIQDALRDNKPMDQFVTELLLMRGSPHTGGSAGFSLAGENDAPFATKAQIAAGAFLGVELQCARCHDSPYHSTMQKDLFALAAMFERKTVTVPKTSMVPAAFFEKKARESLIKATLRTGEPVPPAWPFAALTGRTDDASLDDLTQAPKDTRHRIAALITAPQNTRFAQVMVNRIWRRYMGAGFVEPVQDWEGHAASHPELLQWLAHEFVAHGYDTKHLTRLILTSQTYQRQASGSNLAASPELRFFNAPERRRLTAEQVVDSLFSGSGQPMNIEEITFDPTGRRAEGARITLGRPTRAWMLASLTNERDRPSLSLPRAQCVTDVMEAFGWSGTRQSPRTDREISPNVLQPGVLANSSLSVTLTRAAEQSELAELAVKATVPESLVQSIFQRFLSRPASAVELEKFTKILQVGFNERLVPPAETKPSTQLPPLPRVTWYNHLNPRATTIAMENEQRARNGPPPDPRLQPAWREVYEDFIWSVINTREFVWLP